MQERVKASFIPKASLKVEQTTSSHGSSVDLIQLIAVVILVTAIAASVGLFLFKAYTEQSIKAKQDSLERARAAFEPATIKELSRLDSRLLAAGRLLASHVAPSKLFDAIEAETLSSVRFRDLAFAPSGDTVSITMHGVAKSFNAVALQSDAFGKSALFSQPIFSGLNLDQVGNVIFDFSATINMAELTYRVGAPESPTLDNQDGSAPPESP